MNIRKLALVSALAVCFVILAVSTAVRAAPTVTTYTVNSLLDAPDANLNNSACSDASGKCTLRAAVMQANKGGGEALIIMPIGPVLLLYAGANEDNAVTGDLDIRSDITIVGHGTSTVVDGFVKDRVFDVHPNAHLHLKQLLVESGYVTNQSGKEGGGIRIRGAQVELTNVTVKGNYAGIGGGIYVNASSSLQVVDSTIRSNHVDFVVGLVNNGGGILNKGTLVVMKSTLSGNTAEDHGGGLYNEGTAELVNTTVGENEANLWGGGGIANSGDNALLQLSNVTIAYNETSGIYDDVGGGGILNEDGGIVVARNTIIAKNTHDGVASDCFGTFASDGYNLIGKYVHCSGFNKTGDQVGSGNTELNPYLTPLGSYGGPTQTYALGVSSPAIDKGNATECADSNYVTLTTDQRGFVRSVDGNGAGGARCDIGAFEYNSGVATATPTKTKTPTKTSTKTPTNTPTKTVTKTATPTHTPVNNSCNAKPAKPALVAPANAKSFSNKSQVTLKWNDVTCETKYRVRVKDTTTNKAAFKKNLAADVTQVKTNDLSMSKTYKWFVKACNDFGCTKSISRMFALQP